MIKAFVPFVAALAGVTGAASAQQYFQASDGTVDYSKAAFADPTDMSNWDIISGTVAITRANTQGIYNPLQEASFSNTTSPAGTLWFVGGTVQDVIGGIVVPGDFQTWVLAISNNPGSTVGVDAVLYLVADDAYVDFEMTSFIGGNSGGAFSYTRAIVPASGTMAPLAIVGIYAMRRRR